jgi:hypothetical protein
MSDSVLNFIATLNEEVSKRVLYLAGVKEAFQRSLETDLYFRVANQNLDMKNSIRGHWYMSPNSQNEQLVTSREIYQRVDNQLIFCQRLIHFLETNGEKALPLIKYLIVFVHMIKYSQIPAIERAILLDPNTDERTIREILERCGLDISMIHSSV